MENTILRIVAGLIFGFVALLGVFMLLAAVTQIANMLRSLFWPSAAGTITESALEIQDRSVGQGSEGTDFVKHSARIAYSYEVDGRPYSSAKVQFENINSGGLANAQRLLHTYPAGSEVTVYFHPARPDVAVLERGLPPGFFGAVIFGLLATTIGTKAVLIALGVLPFRTSELMTLGTCVGAMLGAGLVWNGVKAIRMGLASRDWPTVPAEVIRSTLLQTRGSSGKKTTYAPDIAYRYEVDGREYTSHEIRAGTRTWSSRNSAERTCAFYPVGKPVEAHVNPLNPADAVLVPGADWLAGIVVVLGVAFIAGSVVVAMWAR